MKVHMVKFGGKSYLFVDVVAVMGCIPKTSAFPILYIPTNLHHKHFIGYSNVTK